MITITTKNASETGGHSFGKDISIYLFKRAVAVDVSGEVPIIRDGTGRIILTIGDLKSGHINVHNSVTEIKTEKLEYLKGTSIKVEDWYGHKYTYDGSSWGNNSDFTPDVIPCFQIYNRVKCTGRATMPDPTCSVCGKNINTGE